MLPRGQSGRCDIRTHELRPRQGGQLGHSGSDLCPWKKRLPLPCPGTGLSECSGRPRPLAPPHAEALEGTGHRELFHGRGTHVGSPSKVRLTRERSPTPRLDDARGGGTQASHLSQADTHRKSAINVEGHNAARRKRVRAPFAIVFPRFPTSHSLHARIDE